MEYVRFNWAGVLLAVCAVALLFVACGQEELSLIPRAVIFGNPEKAGPGVSPDGKMLAYLAPYNDVLNVWVRTIGKEDDKPVTHDTDRGIFLYLWAEDGKHVLYLQDIAGNENWHLYAVNIETDEIRELTPYEGVRVEILEHDKHFPDELVISMNKEDARVFDVYRLDLTTGDTEMMAKNPGNIAGWVTDTNMKVRGAVVATLDGGIDFYIRDDTDTDWEKLITWDSDNSLTSGPLGFTKDGNYLYLRDSRDANASRLVKVSSTTGELVEVLAEDTQYDIANVMINQDTYEVQAVTFEKARREWVILDESIKEDFDAIRALDEGDLFLTSRDNDDRTWIVGFTKDNGPIPYYAYDRETKEATFLFDHRPVLNDFTLARMEPISYNASDGRTIHGYITFPPGKGRKSLPTVLNVHGGPYYRDSWGYNPEAQWLANRGYVCLQVNFRGSTGYGKDHLNAADKEWGGKMHDDLIDGVNWAIEEGYADPDRVAIYGGSYGGYAALVGATFTPDVFRCAVDMVGPSNLITWIETVPPYWTTMLNLLYKRIGNPETERDLLESRSPLFKVDQIQIPVLIAHGANDPRVKQAESEQIVEAMKEKGIEYEYLLFPDEGHGFAEPENRLKFYAATERFLAKHLGGRFEESEESAEE